MHAARFVLTPYYEIMDSIMPLRRLFLDETASLDTNGRLRGHQMVEFTIRYDHSLLLSESKRQKIASFNVRSVMRFCKVDEMHCDEHGIRVKDALPRHLNIDLNNTLISLPNLLPNDRSGKDGRRFPRPVDLTEGLIDNPIITNRMYLSWVQDESRRDEYYFSIYLVRLRSCDELTSLLLSQHISTVKTTLSLVYDQCVNLNGAVDDDVMLVNTSINMSLNCPVSRGRMKIPIRGQNCNHLQCFDCMTYLVMNYKKPTWLCPVCDKKTFFCYLEVDGLIFNIIKDDRSKSVEHIQFNKSGQWRPVTKTVGSNLDDKPYYDITEYIKQNEKEMSVKLIASQGATEGISDNKVEQYLNQVLNCQKPTMPMHNPKFQHNINLQSNGPSSTIVNGDPKLMFGNVMCSNNIPSIPTIAQYSHPTMSHNMVRPPRNPVSVSVPPLSTVESKTSQETVNNNQLFKNMLMSHYRNNVNNNMSNHANDLASKLHITKVQSLEKSRKNDVIVISDDEEDNSDDVLLTTTSIEHHAKGSRKRPIMTSSAPSFIVSSKQMKLADIPNMSYSRPHSASINEYQAPSNHLSKLCACVPSGGVCSTHAGPFTFINRMMSDYNHTVAPANHSHQTDLVTSSTVHHPIISSAHHPMTRSIPCQAHKSSEPQYMPNNITTQSDCTARPTERHFLNGISLPRSFNGSDFSQSFMNHCMLDNFTKPTNHQTELGYRSHMSPPNIYPPTNLLVDKGPPSNPTTHNISKDCSQESMQAQWIQLINSCPMPYVDRHSLLHTNTSAAPSHTTVTPCTSYHNPQNMFYTGLR